MARAAPLRSPGPTRRVKNSPTPPSTTSSNGDVVNILRRFSSAKKACRFRALYLARGSAPDRGQCVSAALQNADRDGACEMWVERQSNEASRNVPERRDPAI